MDEWTVAGYGFDLEDFEDSQFPTIVKALKNNFWELANTLDKTNYEVSYNASTNCEEFTSMIYIGYRLPIVQNEADKQSFEIYTTNEARVVLARYMDQMLDALNDGDYGVNISEHEHDILFNRLRDFINQHADTFSYVDCD